MKDFTKTQMFTTFIENSIQAKQKENEVSYFIKGCEILQNEGSQSLDQHVKLCFEEVMFNYRNVT